MKKIFYGIFVANLAAIFFIWYSNSGEMLTGTQGEMLTAGGRLSGLLAEFLILTQLVLISRISFIESAFGHDKFNRVHRTLGFITAGLILSHPILVTFGHSGLNEIGFIQQFIIFIQSWDDVLPALIGVILLISAAIASVTIIRKKLKYESWHLSHLLIYAAIFLVFEHQIQSGDVSDNGPLYYWLTLNFTIFGLLILFRILRPIYLTFKFNFTVAKIQQETDDVISVYISGKNLENFNYESGQFAILNFIQKGLWSPHPFSFSSAPNRDIRFSIKAVGDFTREVSKIKPGTRVILDGPLGIFTENSAKREKYLFIAGGIGITPIKSLLETISKKGKDAVLLYSSKDQNNIVFKDELSSLPVKTLYYISGNKPEVNNAEYNYGRITKEELHKNVPDLAEREIYICGPIGMMEATVESCVLLGAKRDQIHWEKFSF